MVGWLDLLLHRRLLAPVRDSGFGGKSGTVKLVFGKEAAEALGVSPWFVSSLKRAGAPFWGNKTDVGELETWLRANPDFVAKHQWTRRKT